MNGSEFTRLICFLMILSCFFSCLQIIINPVIFSKMLGVYGFSYIDPNMCFFNLTKLCCFSPDVRGFLALDNPRNRHCDDSDEGESGSNSVSFLLTLC